MKNDPNKRKNKHNGNVCATLENGIRWSGGNACKDAIAAIYYKENSRETLSLRI